VCSSDLAADAQLAFEFFLGGGPAEIFEYLQDQFATRDGLGVALCFAIRLRVAACVVVAGVVFLLFHGATIPAPGENSRRQLTSYGTVIKVRASSAGLPAECRGGGIGRRAGFRCQWGQLRGGSSPLLGTILKALLQSTAARRFFVVPARQKKSRAVRGFS